jgi:hypothetical protein
MQALRHGRGPEERCKGTARTACGARADGGAGAAGEAARIDREKREAMTWTVGAIREIAPQKGAEVT